MSNDILHVVLLRVWCSGVATQTTSCSATCRFYKFQLARVTSNLMVSEADVKLTVSEATHFCGWKLHAVTATPGSLLD